MPTDYYSLGYDDGCHHYGPIHGNFSPEDYARYCEGYRDGWEDRHYDDVYNGTYDYEYDDVYNFENDF